VQNRICDTCAPGTRTKIWKGVCIKQGYCERQGDTRVICWADIINIEKWRCNRQCQRGKRRPLSCQRSWRNMCQGSNRTVWRLSLSASCSIADACVLKDLWKKMYDAMLASIENITIKDLVTQEKEQKTGTMYHI